MNENEGDVDGAAGKKGKWARTQCEFDSANSFIEGVPKIEPFEFPEPECSAEIEQRCEDLFVDLDEDGNNRFAPCLAQVRIIKSFSTLTLLSRTYCDCSSF